MPHQCVRCNKFYGDGAKEILQGCSCGGKLFFYVRKEKVDAAKKEVKSVKLNEEQKEQIEKDVYALIGGGKDEDKTVVLDLETVRVLSPGRYELDLVSLFKGEPIIFKLEEGKYVVDLARTLEKKK